MLRPLLCSPPPHRARAIWIALEALTEHAQPLGRWMWAPLHGGQPEDVAQGYAQRHGLPSYTSFQRVEGDDGQHWLLLNEEGHGLLGRRHGDGTLVLPAPLRLDGHQRIDLAHNTDTPHTFDLLWRDGKGRQRRTPLDQRDTTFGVHETPHQKASTLAQQQGQGPMETGHHGALHRLRSDISVMGKVFDTDAGDGRLPHLQDGTYGPSLWPAAAPRPALPQHAAQAEQALHTAAVWLWGARARWGKRALAFGLAREGYATDHLVVATPGRHPWQDPKRSKIVVEHLPRAFPPAIADLIAGSFALPLGKSIRRDAKRGRLTHQDAAAIAVRLDTEPTSHALLAALAQGAPTDQHRAFWDAVFAKP